MPSLSERDFGHVEKLFNAIRSVLDYDRAHRKYDAVTSSHSSTATTTTTRTAAPATGDALTSSTQQTAGNKNASAGVPANSSPAVASTVTPSKILLAHQEQRTENNRSRNPTAPTTTVTTGTTGSTMAERRLWAELAFLMWRVVGLQKLSLMAFVTNDPGVMLVELARALLNFLKESCAAFADLGKQDRMRQVALLAQDRLLFLLRVFCNLKNCTVMLSETSGASSATDGRAVFDAICAVVVAGQHFFWMSQIYVWFCDEAARFARACGAIPSAYVYATHDTLRCILGCCTDQKACARAFLYSEPVAYVTYMFYGLKLRISTCDVLRPYEDDHALKDTPGGTAAAAAAAATTAPEHCSPIPLRPPGARYLKTRYFGSLMISAASVSASASPSQGQQQQQQQRDGPIVVNCSAVASLVRPLSSSSSSTSAPMNTSTSWAFDMPDLTREQLKQLLLGGRENSFDALLFAALDVVIEVLHVTRDYGHWMVLSTVSNLLLLSKRNIDGSSAPAATGASATASSSAAAPAPASPSLSQVVAMYENITVMFEFLFSLMQGLGDDLSAGGDGGSGSPGAEKAMAASGGDVAARTAAVKSGKTSRSGLGSDLAAPTPAPERSATATAPHDTAQLREDLSQQLVHIVLQTDVHAVVAATTRVLQCDRTLFRVLHQFCVLDARTMEQPKLLPRVCGPDNASSNSSSGIASPGGARRRGNASQALTVTDTTSTPYAAGAGGGTNNTSRTLTGSSLPFGSPCSGSAATLVPYLTSSPGPRAVKRSSGLDGSNNTESGAPVFNAAASFFTTANFGDLRQMVNEMGVGSSETPNSGPSGELGGSHGSLHGSRGSGLGGSAVSPNAGAQQQSQRRSASAQKLQQQRRLNRGQGNDKKAGNASGGGGENFAKSFFKSFFGSSLKSSGGFFTRGISNDVDDDDDEGNSDNNGSCGGNSASSDASSSLSGDSNGDSGSDDGDDFVGAAVNMSGTTSPPTPRSSCSPRWRRPCRGHKHRHSRTKARPQYSPWRDVPSYTALVGEFVRILNLVLADAELSIDVRLGAGLLLPSVVLRDSQVFRLYEGRVLIRNYLSLLLHELQHNIKLRSVADDSPSLQSRQVSTPTKEVAVQEHGPLELPSREASEEATPAAATVATTVVNGRAHLTQRELIAFAPRVIEALEQTFKVLGATPLTSDVASLTELPLYFFCADGKTPLGLALERSFTRVVVLWLIGLVGAQCDEDIDKHAMEVLLHLMSRAVTRGSLPRDSATTLMLNAAGTATIVQISPVYGAAVPTSVQAPPGTSSGDWIDSRRLLLGDEAATGALTSQAVSAIGGGGAAAGAAAAAGGLFAPPSGLVETPLAGGARAGPAATAAAATPLAPLADNDSGDLTRLYRSHASNSLFDNAEFVGLAAAAGVDRAAAECGNTVEALGSVFRVLLGRSPDLLTQAGLATVLALFTSHESNVSRLGRECMMRSLETPSSYALYADVIRDSDTFTLTQTLSVISAYLSNPSLTPVARHERRVWMQRSGCVDAVVRVLVRVLDSPHSTPTFMKIIPHLFQLLSAFESVDHKAPQLSSTNFVAAVTERLEKLEGTEYFIIVTQAVLDACMGTYGGVDVGYTNAGGPGAHYAEMQVVGNFHIAQYNSASEKPVFLELLPPLLRFAEKHNAHLYRELVEVLFRVVECTGSVRSDGLADFILDHDLSQMLPYLELSGAYIEERLPFTGSATELHRFWQPVLLRAPRRSELRFTSYGGVQVSIGTWPDTGFTIAAWFKFDRLYTTVPLFEFHGVMSESGSSSGGGGGSSQRGSSNLTALLFVFGGDSMQLALNDARRTTVNESQALQNFAANKWIHICAVLRTTQVLDVYVSGFKVGATTFPAYSPGSEVRVNVGCTDEQPHHQYSSGTSVNAAPLYSLSDVTLWAQALNRSQVEAELASNDCRATGDGRPVVPAKILEDAIPQELAIVRNMGNPSAGTATGSPGLTSGSFASFAALINSKQSTSGGAGGGGAVSNLSMGAGHDARSVLGLSFSTAASGGGGGTAGASSAAAAGGNDDDGGPGNGGSGWATASSRLPISTRIARFVPYENDDNLLRNVLSNSGSSGSYPVVAKLVGRYATPPKTWVDYPLLWATRGGVMRLLDWLHFVTSSAQLEGLLQLIAECLLRTTLTVTLDPRTYMLFGYMLTHHVAAFFTSAACDQLLTLASSHLNVFDEEHRIIINRLAFEHILGNVAFYAAIPLEAALYLLQRVRRLFHTSQCRYAKHNARFVIPYRFVDRLLHSLLNVAALTPLPLRRAVVQVAQQVVVACDMEEGLVQIFLSLVALLTPEETTVTSGFNSYVKVTLPTMSAITHGRNFLPLRTANNLTTLLLTGMVECMSQGPCITALARTVDLPWYASCLSRFADPASVVFATRIFFEAVEHNPLLQEEAMQHQAAIIEALAVHAAHEDLVLLLLAQTVGAARHVDVLSRKHSLLQQLDGLMNTFHAQPNSLVAPIFVKIFVVHLYRTVQMSRRPGGYATTELLSEQRLSYRVRRYLSLVRVCSRLMILIRVKRYRLLLMRRPLLSASGTAVLGPASVHDRTRSAGLLSSTSPNMSFAQSGGTGPAATATLGNASFVSNALVGSGGGGGVDGGDGIGGGGSAPPPPIPSLAASSPGQHDALVNSGDGGGPLHALSPQTPSLVGRSSAGGDGYADDGDLPGTHSVVSGLSEGRQLPQPFLPAMLGGEEGSPGPGKEEGVVDTAPQWKPPVLLPDIWTVPAARPTATSSAPVTSQLTTPQTLSLPHHLPTDPASVAAAAAAAAIKTPGEHVSSSDDSDKDNDEGRMASSQFYVHLRKRKRAFAVLRVCVLLWLPMQVRRSRWIFTPYTQPCEEDYATRHAGTLFCIRMFRHFASVSSNFYLFANSPLQIGALSALVAYISRDMLIEATDMWDHMIRTLIVVPTREGAVTADNLANAVAVSTPTTYESSTTTTVLQPTPSNNALATFSVHDLDAATSGGAAAPQTSKNASKGDTSNAEDSAKHANAGPAEAAPTTEAAVESDASTTLPLVLPLPSAPHTTIEATAANTTTHDVRNSSSSGSNGGGMDGLSPAVLADEALRASASTAPPALSTWAVQKASLTAPPGASAPSLATATPSASLPASATRQVPQVSSMTFRSADSSSAQIDQMTVLESPEGSVQFVDDVEDDVEDVVATASRVRRRSAAAAAAAAAPASVGGDGGVGANSGPMGGARPSDRQADDTPNMSFDQNSPLQLHVTQVPSQRGFTQQHQQQQKAVTDLQPSSAVAPAVAKDASLPAVAGPESSSVQPAPETTGAVATAAAALTSTADPGGEEANDEAGNRQNDDIDDDDDDNDDDDEDDDDDDDGSSSSASSSPASSQSSVASTNSTPSTFSSAAPKSASTAVTENTALSSGLVDSSTKKAVNAAAPSFSNLPEAPSEMLTHDPADVYALNIAKAVACAGEVVRRDAVGILRALIRSSLNTLPVPHWIGGPTYGSCGGLLFQLLLVVSAKAVADDATTTLVRFFLLLVGNAVKEQRDRELQPQQRQDSNVSPHIGAPSTPSAVPTLSGLGNTSFGHGGTAAGSPLTTSRGAPGLADALNNNNNNNNAALPAMGGSGSNTGDPLGPPSTSLAETPPPAATQQSATAAPRHSVQFAPSPLSQRTVSSNLAHSPHLHGGDNASLSGTGIGTFSDIFLFNVNHFTDLIVDMLAINVLDLPMATHYFLTLLVLCQEWPSRYIDQLSSQVIRACIAVLNRPSTQDASVSLMESIYTLTTLVLRHGWKRKGVLECLFRVLYRVYGSLPPAWMSDEDAKHRKRLITLIFRHIVQTYAGTKELEKALTVRTLTQRLSLYDDFIMVFSLGNEDECVATFEQYCIAQSSSIETLMSGRLKAKADLAFKASIKTRSEYIKRIKAFNSQYMHVTEVADRYRKAALRSQYAARFSSYVATTPLLDASQLHWLLSSTCALRDDHGISACVSHLDVTTTTTATTIPTTTTTEAQLHNSGEVTLYHFLDSQMNYGELKGVLWGRERTGRSSCSSSMANKYDKSIKNSDGGSGRGSGSAVRPSSSSSSPASPRGSPNASFAPSPLDHARRLSAANSAAVHEVEASHTAAGTAATAEHGSVENGEEEQPGKNDLVRAAQCEEVVLHIAVLLPPFSTRCRPHIGDEALPMSLKDLSITLTPSAMTLLRYLLPPHETLRFLSNGFRINGIHATPCLILLTNTALTIIAFSRVTETGDIILCEYEDDDDDETQSRGGHARNNSTSNNSTAGASPDAEAKATPAKASRRNLFSMSSMTRQLQKFFTDSATKRRQQRDGTRVAQAVRQVMGRNYQNMFWTYLVGSIRAVRSLRYMHLDTAVQLQLFYDEGPMLSVVDAKQSMNPSARKEFIKVLKDVVAPQQCTFIDETQRAAIMKSNLVRWATGALSNYEYLRFLNEVAGRTNRDLNQYPVFPWVLADYASPTLDLESASTFRNFGYPMGAQTEARRAIVSQLFENTREVCDADTGKSYPFHHGTHYSTSGGVLYFLLRVQPFTTYARLFQGGDFDLAMRLFDSVAASYNSCVTGPADCKELIPEFYVNSSFLANADRLALGVKSDGEAVDDVHLPPWAKNSRQVFTAVMRYALESGFVVEHLHQWIDLVFGVRRRGPLAMERYNVFQRMTYGEEVAQALKDAATPHDCDVIIAEVDNFGQTPQQLFQERHPSHQELAPVLQGYAADGAGGGNNASSSSNSGSGAAGRGGSTNTGNVNAITLGGLYASAHSAAASAAGGGGSGGTQLGSTFSNLLSSGTFASGQTYTQAFRREAPKVVRMLIHAMGETQTWFVLRDPPASVLQHPPPPALADSFRNVHPAVLNFTPLHTSKKLACGYAQLVPVPDTDYYLCWHEREARLMRYTAGQAVFQSMVAFNPPDESGARISAVAVGTRESILLIAISTGAVYCLFPDELLNGALHLRVTLCYHRNAVEKIVLDSQRHRAVTITRGHSDDAPILWRVQRSGCSFLCRLSMERLLPLPTAAQLAVTGQTAEDAKDARNAVDAAVDAVSGNIVIATARSLALFDNNGEPFGVGTLPSPSNVRAVDSVTLEDDNGEVGVVVGRAVVVMPSLSSVAFYQTSEWAAGMSVLVTGHVDGSLSVWRCTRLPPDTVEPGKIAVVEFHARLFSGAATAAMAAATAAAAGGNAAGAATGAAAGSGSGGQDSRAGASPPSGRSASLSRHPTAAAAAVGTVSFSSNAEAVNTALAGLSGSQSTAAVASTINSAGCVGTGTGATNCPVTCLHQERVDVPVFLVGYENGSVRQLVFDDPAGTTSGGSGGGGGTGGGRDGGAGDDRGQRR